MFYRRLEARSVDRRTRTNFPSKTAPAPRSVSDAGSGAGSGASYDRLSIAKFDVVGSKVITAWVNGETVPEENEPMEK